MAETFIIKKTLNSGEVRYTPLSRINLKIKAFTATCSNYSESDSGNAMVYGYPNCADRWNTAETGIRARLLKELNPNWVDSLKATGSGQDTEEYAISVVV